MKEWVDATRDNSMVAKMREEPSQNNIYVRIVGKMSGYDGKKEVVAYSVRRTNSHIIC